MATVTRIEIKYDKNNKPYKSVSLDSPILGKDRFNIFQRHARYEDVTEGRAFAPEEFRLENGYLGMVDPDQGIKRANGGTRGGFNVAAAQERKTESIEKAQGRKDESIKISSTARDATLILTAIIEKATPSASSYAIENLTKEWTSIRAWLWQEWDNTDKLDHPPF